MSKNSTPKIKNKTSRIKLYLFANALILSSDFLHANGVQLADINFDPAFLDAASRKSIDLSRFQKAGHLPPGLYPLDIYKNGIWTGKENISIIDENGASKICLTPSIVSDLDINWSTVGKSEQDIEKDENGCLNLFSAIPDFKISLSSADLSINLIISQLYINKIATGYIPPEKWSPGVSAGFVNYRINAYNSIYKNSDNYSSFFGNFNTGININNLRFRHNGTYSKATGGRSSYQSQSTYLQRDIAPILSRMTLGQHYTQGDIFDSVAYSGAEIRSDDRMFPESQTGFAPIITGVADSNARVTVFQNNQQIYETTVSPGPFSINDLYNTGYNGDLNVVITESDGRVKRFTVAYSNIVQLLRPGMSRYSIIAGQYRDSFFSEKPTFIEATYQRGINNLMTAYTGLRAAKDYNSGVLGLALNTPLGAIAGDMTLSRASNLPASWLNKGGASSGQSYRITMNKLISETNTNLVLAAYRYSKQGYLGFHDFVRAKNAGSLGIPGQPSELFGSIYPQREKFQIYLNQKISDTGSIYVSGVMESYWDQNKKRSSSYQFGYSHLFKGGISANLSYNHYENYSTPNQLSLILSIPLEYKKLSRLGLAATRDSKNNKKFSTIATGYLGDERDVIYSVYADAQTEGGSNSYGGNMQYNTRYAEINAGASSNYHGGSQINAAVNGSFVIHRNGINFAKPIDETFGLVYAPGAAGARINGNKNSLIASNDYGVIENLTPYRKNNIWLDTEGSSDNVEVVGNAIYVAPTAGAIAQLEFKTKTGRAVLLQVKSETGERPPIGAQVFDENNAAVLSVVGQGGYIYFRGIDSIKNLKIVWNTSTQEMCYFTFIPTEEEQDKYSPYDQQKVTCNFQKENRSHYDK